MKAILKISFLLIGASLLNACWQNGEKKNSNSEGATEEIVVTKADSSDVKLSSKIPQEITANPPISLESLQHDFDVFSWQSFIALNWPANPDGTPNTNLNIGQNQSNPTVWQMWKSSREIFLPNGEKPNAWGR